ncbi:MAG TPA: SAM-dependent chlorinase/fluorinase [Mycobacteriales bacterium]|nr:SAM-dependent chlorinase/fluorinase [Mycobacteriales bacterium]
MSDYGLDDVFVGVCKGVMGRIAPDVRILDICHLVAPQDVGQGATVFASAMSYLPTAVHLGLVDPRGATPTRGVAVRTADGSLLVGPDNGVLSLAWEVLGGPVAAYVLANDALWLDTPSDTFRGRDVFAPVAAHLASGTPVAEVGPSVTVDGLVRLRVRDAVVDDDHVHAEVRNVDHFGNLSLNVARSDLEAAGMSLGDSVELRCNGRSLTVPFTVTYGDVPPGRLALCEDAFRAVTLAVNLGHAGRTLRVGRGDPIVISRIQQPAGSARR